MVKFYAMQIKLDKITLQDVPVKWKSRVEKHLLKFLEKGVITQEQYDEIINGG